MTTPDRDPNSSAPLAFPELDAAKELCLSGSGYTHCACRDCFVTVSNDMSNPDYCDACEGDGLDFGPVA